MKDSGCRWFRATVLALAVGLAGCAGTPQAAAPVDPAATRTVRASLLNLLECPSLTCSVLEDLHAGDKVAVLTPDIQGWRRVRDLATGREGFVLSRFLAP